VGRATTASAVGGAGAAAGGAIEPAGDAPATFAVAPGDPLVPALTLTSDEGPACAPRACVEVAICGDNGSKAPRSPLPLTSVSAGHLGAGDGPGNGGPVGRPGA
jgi:hypothetical protein